MMPCTCGTLNNRGLAFPGCARGVTVPISINPKPNAAIPSITAPFLSKPAASPTGFEKLKPMTLRAIQTGG